MQKKTKKKNGSEALKLALMGTALAGLAATTYFFAGPKGKLHRRHAKAWAIKMKGDVVEKLEQASEITEPLYHEIIDSVATEYKNSLNEGHVEIDDLAKDLKKHWKNFSSKSDKRSRGKK